MGKLDYLSKYTDQSTDHKKKKKKKEKKDKSRSSNGGRRKNRDAGEVFVRDDDYDSFPIKQEDDPDDDDDDEDRPVVVPIMEDSTNGVVPNNPLKHERQQEWTVVSTGVKGTSMDHDNDDLPPRRKRYDSDDDDDDDDEPPRRQRHDSEDNSNYEIKRGSDKSMDNSPRRNGRRSNDDDDDNEPSSGRKRCYNSSDDESPKRSASTNHESVSKKKHYDSDDDESSLRQSSHKPRTSTRRRRKRYDSDDEDVRIKRENDSDESEPRRRRRYDSDASDENHSDRSRSSRKRVKSQEAEENENDDNKRARERMSSGHVAGLQQAANFREAEHVIQRNKRKEAQAMVDKYGMGDTIYRDEHGRQVEDAAPTRRKSPQMSEKEQAELNKGRVQKEKEDQTQKRFQQLRESTFARHADDGGLEDLRKDIIRKGDPMAAYAMKKKANIQAASGKPQRPMYKGPAPKPNRFGIPPGYRWDGVDRGNGFEDKVLASKYSVDHKKEQAYRWSTSDM